MTPILDPRAGDIEDDASSTKQRSLLSLAGSLLAEISLPKLIFLWVLLIGIPALLVGATPLVVSLWLASVRSQAATIFTDIWPALLLLPLAAFAWFAGRPLLLLAETSFWSLNALAVQPLYIAFREGLRHLAETLLPSGMGEGRRAAVRSGTAAASGSAICVLAVGMVAAVWPSSRWIGNWSGLTTPHLLAPVLLANSLVLMFAYLAVAALVWGIADAAMAQPRGLHSFAAPAHNGRVWRVAHLSDLHAVGEQYGFRVESGRAGPRGNAWLQQTFARLEEVHAANRLDAILVTGDMTDAGRSAEWAEFFAILARHPALAPLIIALPGNHDVNVVDRANPARMDLPNSPTKRLRQLRTLSALDQLQGRRLLVVDRTGRRLGGTLGDMLQPHARDMKAFADQRSSRLGRGLAAAWDAAFPMVLPPDQPDGLGIIVLNSNAATHFSFTNALGLASADQARALSIVTDRFPRACWIIALHHHVIEYPERAKALSIRIGTALINGSWFVRRLQSLAHHAVVMHGHRHVDWIGECGGLLIVSAPSPVMGAADRSSSHFYVHTLAIGADKRLSLLQPERIVVCRCPASGELDLPNLQAAGA